MKIIIHYFIVKHILIAPLNTSQSDMPYFFETSHEHFVSSIGRRPSEIFDYSIKGDRHISRSSVATRRTNAKSLIHKIVTHRFRLCASYYRWIVLDLHVHVLWLYRWHSNIPFRCYVFDVMEEQTRQRSDERARHNTINTKLPTNFGFS